MVWWYFCQPSVSAVSVCGLFAPFSSAQIEFSSVHSFIAMPMWFLFIYAISREFFHSLHCLFQFWLDSAYRIRIQKQWRGDRQQQQKTVSLYIFHSRWITISGKGERNKYEQLNHVKKDFMSLMFFCCCFWIWVETMAQKWKEKSQMQVETISFFTWNSIEVNPHNTTRKKPFIASKGMFVVVFSSSQSAYMFDDSLRSILFVFLFEMWNECECRWRSIHIHFIHK